MSRVSQGLLLTCHRPEVERRIGVRPATREIPKWKPGYIPQAGKTTHEGSNRWYHPEYVAHSELMYASRLEMLLQRARRERSERNCPRRHHGEEARSQDMSLKEAPTIPPNLVDGGGLRGFACLFPAG